MDKRVSVKFSVVLFLLLTHVVFGHALNIKYEASSGWSAHNIVYAIENFTTYKLAKMKMPMFFFISAYLFFKNIKPGESDSFSTFRVKISRRLRTLGIPYLFWCAFWFAAVYGLQQLPALEAFFPTKLADQPIGKQFFMLYIDPVNYPFWFLRELMLYIIATPLLYRLVLKFGLWPSAVAMTISLFYKGITVSGIEIYVFQTMAYYCLGIHWSIRDKELRIPIKDWMMFALIFIGFCLCGLLIWLEIRFPDTYLLEQRIINNITGFIGFISCWTLYDYLDDRLHFRYHPVFAYGFFLFAAHGLPTLWLREALIRLLNPSPWLTLAFQYLTFAVIFTGCVATAMLLRKVVPKFYLMVTGNR